MEWETYYERFYDWSESTQISRISSLKTFGPSEEIAEVVQNIWDEAAASRLIQKALKAGVRFTAEEVCGVKEFVNDNTLQQMAVTARTDFTASQMEEITDWVNESTYDQICSRTPESAVSVKPKSRTGLMFGFGLLGVLFSGGKKRHSGRCDGNCSSCPPHYGYRYGRWYYGHDHIHGCEFGGNKGSGSID